MAVQEKLLEYGLNNPELEVLKPNNQNYSCALLQSSGPIYADSKRIGHLNVVESELRCKAFLEAAYCKDIELVVTPEYSVPWNTLKEITIGDKFPAPGRLWVLGCESATIAEIESFKETTSARCKTFHENIPPHGNFTDPLAYCFQTKDLDGTFQRVIILQFKTTASRDELFLENENLKCGKVIYQFQNQGSQLKLASIICSDSFGISDRLDILNNLSDRSILIHIQLNPKPRQIDYRAYRAHIFRRDSDLTNCDIICLNWAQNVEQYGADLGKPAKWNNIAGSAWYLPKNRCSTVDENVIRNHEKGLYYSYLEEHRHGLFFHYDEAVFVLNVSKPLFDGPAVLANKQGPLMTSRWTWDDPSQVWQECPTSADSGLNTLIADDTDLQAALSDLVASSDPLAVERALALVCGTVKCDDNWFKVNELDSCQIAADEILKRITFANDKSDAATKFRHTRLQHASILGKLLTSNPDWPPQVNDIQGAKIKWISSNPNYNTYKNDVDPAVIIYLGEHPLNATIINTRDKFLHILKREGRRYYHRLAICYRHHGNLSFAEMPSETRYDNASEHVTDFTMVLDSNGTN